MHTTDSSSFMLDGLGHATVPTAGPGAAPSDPADNPARETGFFSAVLEITDAGELAQAEADFSSTRMAQLRRSPLLGRYDLDHLQDFHHYVFGDVYPWAGELRTVSIGKGHLFCLPQHLESFAADVFGKLAQADHLHHLPRPAFIDGLTALFADINALHPFREGNGRTQRAFLGQLAREAGHPVRWPALDAAENLAASRAAHTGEDSMLRAMLDRLVATQQPPPRTPTTDPPR